MIKLKIDLHSLIWGNFLITQTYQMSLRILFPFSSIILNFDHGVNYRYNSRYLKRLAIIIKKIVTLIFFLFVIFANTVYLLWIRQLNIAHLFIFIILLNKHLLNIIHLYHGIILLEKFQMFYIIKNNFRYTCILYICS